MQLIAASWNIFPLAFSYKLDTVTDKDKDVETLQSIIKVLQNKFQAFPFQHHSIVQVKKL
jgi:hypothetical protein